MLDQSSRVIPACPTYSLLNQDRFEPAAAVAAVPVYQLLAQSKNMDCYFYFSHWERSRKLFPFVFLFLFFHVFPRSLGFQIDINFFNQLEISWCENSVRKKKYTQSTYIQIYVGRKVPKGNEWLVVVYFPSVTLLELSTVELYCPMITFSSVFIDQREADATISNFFAGINISNSVICLVTFKLWFLVLVSQAREYRYQETTGVCIYGSVYGSKNDACFNFVHVGSQFRFRHCSQHNWHTKDSLTLEIQKV